MGTRGNHSPNIPPRSDPERIIREARAQQNVGSSSVVDKPNVKKKVESLRAILIPELEVFSHEEEGIIKLELIQQIETFDPENILDKASYY